MTLPAGPRIVSVVRSAGEGALRELTMMARSRQTGFLLVAGMAFGLGFGLVALGTAWRGTDALRSVSGQSGRTEAPTATPAPTTLPAAAPKPRATSAAGPIAVPPPPPAATPPSIRTVRAELEVRRGDTLLALLTRAGIARREAHAAVDTLRPVANLKRLRTGQLLAVETELAEGAEPRLVRLVWRTDVARELHLVRGEGEAFTALPVERPLRREPVHLEGRVAGSLYQSARAAGLPAARLPQMVAVLSWDLDLQREVQPGDRFETVVERRLTPEGDLAAYGDLLFVGLETRGRTLAAYRFAGSDGEASYFDRDGRALRTWLLKTPVDGARLSSAFGLRRHPVLGYTRLHKGADFAAPTGTPILAAGDGEVEFAGRNRGYGRYLRIRHNAAYTTAYAHLHRLAPGIKAGRRVRQGQVIGTVGSTGLVTGPHLHYEVLHEGQPIDPASLRSTVKQRLEGPELRRFQVWRATVDALRAPPAPERQVAQDGL